MCTIHPCVLWIHIPGIEHTTQVESVLKANVEHCSPLFGWHYSMLFYVLFSTTFTNLLTKLNFCLILSMQFNKKNIKILQLNQTYICIQIQLWKVLVRYPQAPHSAEKKNHFFFLFLLHCFHGQFRPLIGVIYTSHCRLSLPRVPSSHLDGLPSSHSFVHAFLLSLNDAFLLPFLLEREGEHWYVNGRLGYICSWRTVDCWDIFKIFSKTWKSIF